MKKLWVFEWNWTKQELCWRQPGPLFSLSSINLLFLMGRLIEKREEKKGCGPQAYAEQRKNEIKFEEFNWVFLLAKHEARQWERGGELSFLCWWVKGGTAARQQANKEDEPPPPTLSFLLANSTILSFVAGAGKANKRIELVGVVCERERAQPMNQWN